jgi:hypothetical protein
MMTDEYERIWKEAITSSKFPLGDYGKPGKMIITLPFFLYRFKLTTSLMK